jgi:deoxyribodipyrimidine photo-lyase
VLQVKPSGPPQVVWFKRDLRVQDHAALARATASGPVLCLFAVELDHWQQTCTSDRQWQFVRECLLDLDVQLTSLGTALEVHVAPVIQMLDAIYLRLGQFTLHSHQETGGLWTYARDRAVAAWCQDHGVRWHEYPQNGVVRPVSRRGRRFKEHWDGWVSKPLERLQPNPVWLEPARDQKVLLLPAAVKTDPLPCAGRQKGGLQPARELLDSFLDGRGQSYGANMSSPSTAEHGTSRLSPHIAHGTLSLRQIAQIALQAKKVAPRAHWHNQLHSYVTRLWWHCYALQGLENQPEMEHKALVPEMEQLSRPMDTARFDAWRLGRTGWPLVDACMRFLHHNGWLNFRMRAMLVTTATHTLSLPWRPVADWLSQMFVDFEPGIHYTQIQMHSSMAASPVLRLYNPVKQAIGLDPQGNFVRRWVPELAEVPDEWIFTPWLIPETFRREYGLVGDHDYPAPAPAPVVEFEQVHRAVKAEIAALRSREGLQAAQGFNERPRQAARGRRVNEAKPPDKKFSSQPTLF